MKAPGFFNWEQRWYHENSSSFAHNLVMPRGRGFFLLFLQFDFVMEGEKTNMIVCEKCGKSGPVFNEVGQHNFCPANAINGKLITIFMECKRNEITAHWSRDKQ